MENLSQAEQIRRAVLVLNAPKGTVNEKVAFLTSKGCDAGVVMEAARLVTQLAVDSKHGTGYVAGVKKALSRGSSRKRPAQTLEVMHVDGSVTTCPARFKDCQTAVGGYVEPVRLPNGDMLLVNEEGILLGLPMNPGATLMACQGLRGPVVVVPKALIKTVLG